MTGDLAVVGDHEALPLEPTELHVLKLKLMRGEIGDGEERNQEEEEERKQGG